MAWSLQYLLLDLDLGRLLGGCHPISVRSVIIGGCCGGVAGIVALLSPSAQSQRIVAQGSQGRPSWRRILNAGGRRNNQLNMQPFALYLR